MSSFKMSRTLSLMAMILPACHAPRDLAADDAGSEQLISGASGPTAAEGKRTEPNLLWGTRTAGESSTSVSAYWVIEGGVIQASVLLGVGDIALEAIDDEKAFWDRIPKGEEVEVALVLVDGVVVAPHAQSSGNLSYAWGTCILDCTFSVEMTGGVRDIQYMTVRYAGSAWRIDQ